MEMLKNTAPVRNSQQGGAETEMRSDEFGVTLNDARTD